MNLTAKWMRMAAVVGGAAVICAGAMVVAQPDPVAPPAVPSAPAEPVDPMVLKGEVKTIDGQTKNLADYRGQVVLIVNVASKCRFTPQYKGLEALYQARKGEGLVILGFPANDFGGQEPGSNKEIAAFCSERFGVTFPMFEKVSVRGENAHALFKAMAAVPAPAGGEPTWNFTKYLIDREGKLVARFESRIKPDDVEMNRRIDELLRAK